MDGWPGGLTTNGRGGPLTDRVALVTGAGRGLGRAIALGLAGRGARLLLVSRTPEELRGTADAVGAGGPEVATITADVGDADAVEKAIASGVERFGRIDVLVNGAGTSPFYKRAEQLEPDEWDAVIGTNLRGTFLCCRSVGRHMLSRGQGAIVNISSVLGTAAIGRLAAYSASKAGVEGLTRALAVEWADRGVRVNAVAPGFIETGMTQDLLASERHRGPLVARTPMGRFGDPDSVVAAVLFLVSDEASYVTGTTVFVDGGWRAGQVSPARPPMSFEEIVDPLATALVVWDMQVGLAGRAHGSDGIVAAVGRLVEAAHARRVPVIWSRHVAPRLSETSPVGLWTLMRRQKVASSAEIKPFMQAGSADSGTSAGADSGRPSLIRRL